MVDSKRIQSIKKRKPAQKATREKPKGKQSKPVSYLLGKGGPTLINLKVDSSEIRLIVNGPGMLFSKLRLLTSLDLRRGATADVWKKLADGISCTALCGNQGQQAVPITVETSRIGSRIEIGLGPVGMYQTELILKTKSGIAFRRLINSILAGGTRIKDYFVGLEPLPGEGHPEHHPHFFKLDQTEPASAAHEHDHSK